MAPAMTLDNALFSRLPTSSSGSRMTNVLEEAARWTVLGQKAKARSNQRLEEDGREDCCRSMKFLHSLADSAYKNFTPNKQFICTHYTQLQSVIFLLKSSKYNELGLAYISYSG